MDRFEILKEKTSVYINPNLEAYFIHGADVQDLLQRISTFDLRGMNALDTCSTILTDEKGKIVDILQLAKRDETQFLSISGAYKTAYEWVDKYVFVEDVKFKEPEFDVFELILGEGSVSLFDQTLIPNQLNLLSYEDIEMFAFVEFSNHVRLCVPKTDTSFIKSEMSDVWNFISNESFTQWRINSFVGHIGYEYTRSFIPLEVGLLDFVSFTKGCYIGQEIIARLDAYKKVSKFLAQLKTEEGLDPEKEYFVTNESGKKLGKLTTIGPLNQEGYYHLGVIHRSVAEENANVYIESDDQTFKSVALVTDVLKDKTYYQPEKTK